MGSNSSKANADAPRPVGPATDIREENRLVIDAASLQCPTCMDVYVRSPLVLRCGHSFCQNCTKHFVCRTGLSTVLTCPLCLRAFPVLQDGTTGQLTVTNFALDTVLDSVRAMAREEMDSTEAIALIPTLRFENKRLRRELDEKDRETTLLRKQMADTERKLGAFKAAIARSEYKLDREEFNRLAKQRRVDLVLFFVACILTFGLGLYFRNYVE